MTRRTWRRGLGAGIRCILALAALAACGGGGAEPEEHGAEEETHAKAPKDVVQLDPSAVSASGIQVGTTGSGRAGDLALTGAIAYHPDRVSHVGARTPGRIVRLSADLGQPVRSGQVLAVLESPDVGAVRAELREAQSLLRIAREGYAREQRLETQGISSRKELLEFEADLRRAEAAVQSARDKLAALGGAGGSGSQFAVTSPFAGSVVARDASLGEMAEPSDTLFTVADLSRVRIELDVFERDLGVVRAGQTVAVTVAAYPGRVFAGRIASLGDVLDTEKRTVRARIDVPNADRLLKPGMFATARVATGAAVEVVTIPRDAVQEMEGRTVVFVPGARAGEFRVRPVQLGEPVDSASVAIRGGLRAGERLVVAGAFTLRSELAKGEIGEHGH
ncbi:MAG TPA: efflux RND transporter periplasmic adaptor subunit [Longimicrobium sp.]